MSYSPRVWIFVSLLVDRIVTFWRDVCARALDITRGRQFAIYITSEVLWRHLLVPIMLDGS